MVFFFFKQKTAYEMRISDWSSDVCSSDLLGLKQCDQLRLHEREVVRDREADDTSAAQVRLELGRELRAVHALHDKDDVCPGQELRRDGSGSVVAQACRGRLDT